MQNARTSEEWVESVEASPEKMQQWLKRQYIGEMLAYQRIKALSENPEVSPAEATILRRIAGEEKLHADWVRGLLKDIPEVSYDGDRYWKEMNLSRLSLDELFAAGFHAETMRLSRIKAIVGSNLPEEIKEVFGKILPMEENHARYFDDLSSEGAKSKTAEYHASGMEALGLEM